MIAAGEIAPDFELSADDGSLVRLSDLRGRKIVLYFYPRADTPGCTVEACGFRDRFERFDDAGTVILGISPDPLKDVIAFRQKFSLPFRLLADVDHRVAELYDVWREKTNYGRKYWGVARTTFLIDEEGRITQVYEKVDPKRHAADLLQDLASANGPR